MDVVRQIAVAVDESLTRERAHPILISVNAKRINQSPADVHGVEVAAWQPLLAAAGLLHRLAPWTWMTPDECFGLRLAPDGPPAFISVMGHGRQNHVCFAFLGWEAWLHVEELMATRSLTVRDLIETPALQLTFVPLADLGTEDRAILACAGPLPAGGATPCPVFRSHRTGYLPWLLNTGEVESLAEILRQTAGVAMRRETHTDLLVPPEPGLIWMRTRQPDGQWRETWVPRPPNDDAVRPPPLDPAKLAAIAALPCRHARIEFNLALSRATIGEKGQRLRTTYLLAAFDSDSGQCIGADVILPQDGLTAMWRSVPAHFLSLCLHANSRPREIEVDSEQMMSVLRPLLGQLPIKLTLRGSLTHFQTFLEGMNKINQP